MNNARRTGAAAIVLILVLCGAAQVLYGARHADESHSAYTEPLAAAPAEAEPTVMIDAENGFAVDGDFTTHLPLVILELEQGEPPISMKREGNIFVPIEGVEPYVRGTFHLIENGTGVNRASDAPALSSLMNIKRRGNSSVEYPKAQWLVKFTTESGQDNDLDVLGMGAEHEWVLNGSLADKSLLRNYLAYSIASEVMPYTPDYKFCEVLINEGGALRYQGVYLLGESIKQGPDRVDIGAYKASETVNGYMLRRDRYDEEGVMLDTFGRLSGLSNEYIGLVYPGRYSASEDMISYVQQDFSAVEKVLYSDDDSLFRTYPDVIDVDSFVDYFLLNEFFISYDAGNNSTYMYKDRGGKLCMGPVWDFDNTMDNYKNEPASTADMAFQTKPLFDRLCADRGFTDKLIKRYTELRRGPLSENHITEKITEIVNHLGGAQERDWLRWNEYYTKPTGFLTIGLDDYELEDGVILHRNAETFAEELYRLRSMLRDHGSAMPNALEELRGAAEREPAAIFRREWLLLLAAAVFIIPSVWVALRR